MKKKTRINRYILIHQDMRVVSKNLLHQQEEQLGQEELLLEKILLLMQVSFNIKAIKKDVVGMVNRQENQLLVLVLLLVFINILELRLIVQTTLISI